MSGQIVHFEIPADDTAKGREFWGSSSDGGLSRLRARPSSSTT